jgi:ABC-type transport system substrate-binding protein
MSYAPTRRQILQGGSALLAAATLGLIRPNAAFAAHDKITVRVERDLGNLDPANRTGPLDVNILNAVMQGLIAFKPGSTEWQLDAAADIKQVSDTEIDFTLRPDQNFTGGYGPLTAEDVKFSFERFITPARHVEVAQLDHRGTAAEMLHDLGQQEARRLPHAGVVERPRDRDRQPRHPRARHRLHR